MKNKPALTEGTMRSKIKNNTSTQVPIAPPPAGNPLKEILLRNPPDKIVEEVMAATPKPKIPLFEFCGASIPANWILGFNFSRASKSITVELPNKGKIKNVYKDADEARDEYTLVIQQYERLCKEAQGSPI